jgi:aarF domain-containing kinase
MTAGTFYAQIFAGGFVHCDPHPGNVLVRPHPGRPSEPQLVLLDHGLYAV